MFVGCFGVGEDQWAGGALEAFWKQHVGCADAPGDWEVQRWAVGVKIFRL
jgi:hypothetical protein